jgi:hypothetical protein
MLLTLAYNFTNLNTGAFRKQCFTPNVYSNEEEFMTCTLGSLSASIFGGSASIELLLCKQRRLAVNVCGC